MYVLDTNVWSQMFRFYYRHAFPSLWVEFDTLVREKRVTSTREVRRELQAYRNDLIADGIARYGDLFAMPSQQEEDFVTDIFSVRHFHYNVPQKTMLQGGINADGLVIARAAVMGWMVVTEESMQPNAAKIPNICEHFDIPCINLHQLMLSEGWIF